MGDGNIAGEIPLLSSFLYLLGKAKRVRRSLTRRRLSRYSRAKGTEWRSVGDVVPARALASSERFTPFPSVCCVTSSRFDFRRMRTSIYLQPDSIRGHCQAGSLTGAVHLSKNNAGVLRPAQRGQKPRVEQKGKSWLDPDVQYA